MKRLLVATVLFATLLSIFTGCQKPRDPNVLYEDTLSEELKQKINHEFVVQCETKVNWDYFNPFYGEAYLGTINDCMIIHTPIIDPIPEHIGLFEVAGYTFKWSSPFNFHVYRDGEACKLKDAYENEWLTEEQIGQIYKKHNGYYENYLRKAQEDDLSAYHPDYFSGDYFPKEMQQEIANALETQCNVTVNWNSDHHFWGIINGSAVVIADIPECAPSYCVQQIAGCDFERSEHFNLYVYRNGESCTLKEAYEKGWLTQVQIGKIHKKYSDHYAKWLKTQEEA